MIRLRLPDGIIFIVKTDIDRFTAEYRRALKKKKLVEIVSVDGRRRIVNPLQVLYFEEYEEDQGDSNIGS